MTLPNFLVIGAAKAGTTSLHHYLRQHPQIYLPPVKETNFFWTEAGEHGRRTVQTLFEYERLFKGDTEHKAIGEVSPQYLNSKTAAERISRDLPDVRIVVVLRNPVDRAWSDYLGRVRILREKGTFEEAISTGRPCLENGFYYPRLKRYYQQFPRERIHIIIYDEFSADARSTFRGLFEFLCVDPEVRIDTTKRHNRAAVPRSLKVNRLLWPSVITIQHLVPASLKGTGLLASMLSMTYRPAPSLSDEHRRRLRLQYYDDIAATADLTGCDLSGWLH